MTKQLVTLPHYATVKSIVDTLTALVNLTPEKDAEIVNVSVAPQTDRPYTDTAILYEQTLSDGSKVYDIELY